MFVNLMLFFNRSSYTQIHVLKQYGYLWRLGINRCPCNVLTNMNIFEDFNKSYLRRNLIYDRIFVRRDYFRKEFFNKAYTGVVVIETKFQLIQFLKEANKVILNLPSSVCDPFTLLFIRVEARWWFMYYFSHIPSPVKSNTIFINTRRYLFCQYCLVYCALSLFPNQTLFTNSQYCWRSPRVFLILDARMLWRRMVVIATV